MKKRYQVFVSSTFEDLVEERQHVIRALLQVDCFPAGMELFNASEDNQWDRIKRSIDESDYYLVILAGRYGSCTPDGISYTEREYDYAVQAKKPVIAFLHKDRGKIPSEKTELDQGSRKRLDDFYEKAKQKRLASFWLNSDELRTQVVLSLVELKETFPAEGWVPSKYASDPETVLALKTRIEELEEEFKQIQDRPPPGTEELSQGADQVLMEFTTGDLFETPWKISYSWDQIFSLVGALLANEASESEIRKIIQRDIARRDARPFSRFLLTDRSFGVVMTQFQALGLIAPGTKKRSSGDKDSYWKLTPFGKFQVHRLVAVRRPPR